MSNADTFFSHQHSEKLRFTPRELIRYHIEHPEIPITDSDIENLVLDKLEVSILRERYQTFKKRPRRKLIEQ